MNREEELERLKPWVLRARGFSGWDLSKVEPRLIDPGPRWSYKELVQQYAEGKKAVIDMGTGGGEFLSTVSSSLPARAVATEEWTVNAPIAQRRLQPLGLDVVRCRSIKLPFTGSTFDLILNRHEELSPAEVARVLAPGGHVITQQVGDHWKELKKHFPRASDFGDLYTEYLEGFQETGLQVIRNEEHDYRVAYNSLGELVYLLTVAPWEVPNFSVERDLEALLALESEQLDEKGLVLTESRFIIIAQK